jgi:hypothetical protein
MNSVDRATKHPRAEIGDVAMPLSCFERRGSDYTGMVVIASTWLILYGIIVIGFAVTQTTELFASQ